jgi:hypothetical protein
MKALGVKYESIGRRPNGHLHQTPIRARDLLYRLGLNVKRIEKGGLYQRSLGSTDIRPGTGSD